MQRPPTPQNTAATGAQANDMFTLAVAPALFVLLWSTGWLVAGLAAPYADPLAFLSVRYAIAALCLAVFAWLSTAPWPGTRTDWIHALFSGVLIHALYLGAVWWAIRHGVPAGVSGVIAALQPILTAMLAPLLINERITFGRWLGIMLGFSGLMLVLAPKLVGVEGGFAAVAIPILINAIGMVSVTLGWFYQKRFIPSGDLRTVSCVQYLGAFLATLPVALLIEDFVITPNLTMALVFLWSVVALSIGAIALLLLLIRRGAVSRAAALVYLVPPLTALQAWLFLGETLTLMQLAGMAITVVGVALAVRK